MNTTRVAVLQMRSIPDVNANLSQLKELSQQAVDAGAKSIVVPEAFSFLGPEKEKQNIVELLPGDGPILEFCRELAASLEVHMIYGGFHEANPDSTCSFNTCLHIDSRGEIQATYRKIHLFDVELNNGFKLFESHSTTPGHEVVTTELPFGTLGLSICYDLRFPYLYQALVDKGAIALAIPSAFTDTTGAAHWHVLMRARAIECQCYVLAAAQCGHHHGKRTSFGHALIVDPWGDIIDEVASETGFAIADIDLTHLHRVRKQLPSLDHRLPLDVTSPLKA